LQQWQQWLLHSKNHDSNKTLTQIKVVGYQLVASMAAVSNNSVAAHLKMSNNQLDWIFQYLLHWVLPNTYPR